MWLGVPPSVSQLSHIMTSNYHWSSTRQGRLSRRVVQGTASRENINENKKDPMLDPGLGKLFKRLKTLNGQARDKNVSQFYFPVQVSNWSELSKEARELKFDIEKLFYETLEKKFGLRSDAAHLLPDLEPSPPEKWLIRVGSPFLPFRSKENVKDAVGKENSFLDAVKMRGLPSYPQLTVIITTRNRVKDKEIAPVFKITSLFQQFNQSL